jgi:hypothetical protein
MQVGFVTSPLPVFFTGKTVNEFRVGKNTNAGVGRPKV